MHVGVLAAPSRAEDARRIMRGLARHDIVTKGMIIDATWCGGPVTGLDQTLRGSSHLLVLPADEQLASWAIYAIAFAKGSEVPVCIASHGPAPAAFGDLPVVAPGAVEQHILTARARWFAERRLLEARARLNNREMSPAAFCAAALERDSQAVEDFLTLGTPPDTRSPDGVPVLVAAIRSRSTAIVETLLASGANPNASCGSDGSSALCEAASMGLSSAVGVLLAHGADPNQITGNGQTALMLAASQGHADILEALVGAGADASRRDSLGMSAYDYAKLFSHEEILANLEKLIRS